MGNMKRFAALIGLALIAYGVLAEPIDDALGKLDPLTRMKLGQRITQKDKTVFGGDLTIRVFETGFVVAAKGGQTQMILLQPKGPHSPPLGDIALVYKQQGAHRTFGQPLEGEHMLFDDTYRLHVFERAIIVWRKADRSAQSTIFDKNFKY